MSNRPLKNKKRVVVEEEDTEHEVEYRSPGKTSKDIIIQVGVVILILSFFLAPMLVFALSPAPLPAEQQQTRQVDDTEEQIKHFSAELTKNPNDAASMANLAFYTTKKAVQMPPTPDNENLRQTLLKEAEGNFRKALENDPDYGFAQAELARNLIFQKNFDEASTFIDQALKGAEAGISSSDATVAADAKARKAQMVGMSASLLAERGDMRGAITKLTEVIELTPGNPQLYKQRAVMHFQNNDKDAARADLTTMVDIGQKSRDQNAVAEGQMMLQMLDQPVATPTPGAATPATGTTPAATGPSTTVTPGSLATPVTITAPATPAAPATP
jgi:tetratricopeptide (TPR) repeat protein